LVKRWTNEELLLPGQVVDQALIAALSRPGPPPGRAAAAQVVDQALIAALCIEEGDESDGERVDGCYLGAH
jgi:hypothetical protein